MTTCASDLQAFQKLIANVRYKKSMRAAMHHMQWGTLYRAWDSWRAFAAEQSAHKSMMRQAAERWSLSHQISAFSAWTKWVADRRHAQSLVSMSSCYFLSIWSLSALGVLHAA